MSISPVAAEHLIIGSCFPFPCGPCCPLAGARGCPAMRVGKFSIPTVCSESVLNSHLFFPYFPPISVLPGRVRCAEEGGWEAHHLGATREQAGQGNSLFKSIFQIRSSCHLPTGLAVPPAMGGAQPPRNWAVNLGQKHGDPEVPILLWTPVSEGAGTF